MCLGDAGCELPPELGEAKQLYAKAMAWGLVIGWLLCPPNNYGEQVSVRGPRKPSLCVYRDCLQRSTDRPQCAPTQVLSANVQRLVAACDDLRTFPMLLGSDSVK